MYNVLILGSVFGCFESRARGCDFCRFSSLLFSIYCYIYARARARFKIDLFGVDFESLGEPTDYDRYADARSVGVTPPCTSGTCKRAKIGVQNRVQNVS